MKKLAAVMVLVGGLAVLSVASARAQGYPADNSGKNVRDRQAAAVTSGDQSNTQSDLDITQEIRKAVIADKDLSTNAHNVKIITANGVVTLRGPVKSSAEKANIGAMAKHVAGVTRVDNQIEIASN
jgi:hyperosmotically inducible periplasmic protein